MASSSLSLCYFLMVSTFLTTGAAFTVLSSYIYHSYNLQNTEMTNISNDDDNVFLYFGLLLSILSGSVMFVGGIIGCLGAVKRSPVLLTVFGMILIIISSLLLTAGLHFALNQDEVLELFQTQMKSLIQNSYGADYMAQSQLWDFTQQNIKCCGADGFQDYSSNDLQSTYMVPKSCCNNSLSEEHCESARNISRMPEVPQAGNDHEFANLHDFESIYKEGCVASLTGWIKSMFPYFGGVIVGMGFIWLLAMLLLTAYFIWTFRYRIYSVANNQIGPERIEMSSFL